MYGWEPKIGDPTVYGWFTVAVYAVATCACYVAATRGDPAQSRFWWVLTAIIAFLCINKQLDLQTLLTDFARVQARRQGWYSVRELIQFAFVALVAVTCLLVTAFLLLRMRRAGAPVIGAIIGLGVVLLFIFLRTASIEKVDWLITRRIGDLSINRLAELGGAAIIILSAWAASRRGCQRS